MKDVHRLQWLYAKYNTKALSFYEFSLLTVFWLMLYMTGISNENGEPSTEKRRAWQEGVSTEGIITEVWQVFKGKVYLTNSMSSPGGYEMIDSQWGMSHQCLLSSHIQQVE